MKVWRERVSMGFGRLAAFGTRATLARPSTVLLVAIVLLWGVLLVSTVILTQYYQRDVLTSLFYLGADRWCDLDVAAFGIHCFGDYSLTAQFAERANPWDEFLSFRFNYTAAGMLPIAIANAIENLVGLPRLGVVLFLGAIVAGTIAVALWAGARRPMLERALILVGAGVASIPALSAVDRGNSVGLIVPIALVAIVAAARGRWGIAVLMIALASFVKPQFAILLLLPFAMRKWRVGLVALGAIVGGNLAAYLVWPASFPSTILQSISNTFDYGSRTSLSMPYPANGSFSRGIYLLFEPIQEATGIGFADFVDQQQSRVGYVIAGVTVVAVLVLGRRLPTTTAGVILLAVGSLFVSTSWMYYLVFVIPIAAVLLRDPLDDRRGWLDVPTNRRERLAGIVVASAAAVSLVQLPLPVFQDEGRVWTTGPVVSLFWIAAIVALLFTARRQNSEAATPSSVGLEGVSR